jgi:tRNA(Leu) C34 or U34 (ribose-2'-O)-methylase TrmL
LVVYERLEGQVECPGEGSLGEAEARSHGGEVRQVTSESNPMCRLARDLLTGRGVRKHGRAVLAGKRLVGDVLVQAPGQVEAWLTGAKGPPPPRAGLLWYRFADPLYRALDVAGTHGPLLLVRVPAMPDWADEDPWPEGCTLFVPLQDPENVGAVIRSAAAFGVAQVVLLREAAHPFHPRSSRAAGPALFQVPLRHGPSIHDLTARGAPLIALDTTGPELGADPWPARFGLVTGVEGPGLPAQLHQGPRRRIAMEPGVESLNAAAATAVALYAWRQRCGSEPSRASGLNASGPREPGGAAPEG